MRISRLLFVKVNIEADAQSKLLPDNFLYFGKLIRCFLLVGMDVYIFERKCCYLVFSRCGDFFTAECLTKDGTFISGSHHNSLNNSLIEKSARRKAKKTGVKRIAYFNFN